MWHRPCNKHLLFPCSSKCSQIEAGVAKASSDSSLNVMDGTPLPCDVHAHLMLKQPIYGTIVFQSCQGKVQNRAHFLLRGVIAMPQFAVHLNAMFVHVCSTLLTPFFLDSLTNVINFHDALVFKKNNNSSVDSSVTSELKSFH